MTLAEGGWTDHVERAIDPETRPYIAVTGYNRMRTHLNNGNVPRVGDVIEFENGCTHHDGRLYVFRGVIVQCEIDRDYPGDSIMRVRILHADAACSGDSWGGTRFRIVRSPGPRVRTLARGYCAERPAGGVSEWLVAEE